MFTARIITARPKFESGIGGEKHTTQAVSLSCQCSRVSTAVLSAGEQAQVVEQGGREKTKEKKAKEKRSTADPLFSATERPDVHKIYTRENKMRKRFVCMNMCQGV